MQDFQKVFLRNILRFKKIPKIFITKNVFKILLPDFSLDQPNIRIDTTAMEMRQSNYKCKNEINKTKEFSKDGAEIVFKDEDRGIFCFYSK